MNQRSLSHELTVLPTRPRPPSSFTQRELEPQTFNNMFIHHFTNAKNFSSILHSEWQNILFAKKSLLKGIRWNAFWHLEKVFEMISSRLTSEFLLFLWSRGKINGCHVSWLLIGWISYQVILSIWSHQQLKWIFFQQCININSDLCFINQSWSSTPT